MKLANYSNMTLDAQRAVIMASTVMAFTTNYAQGKITSAFRLALRLQLEDSTIAQRNHYYTKIARFAANNVKSWGRDAAKRFCERRSVPIAYYCKARHDLARSKVECEIDIPMHIPSLLRPQAERANEI